MNMQPAILEHSTGRAVRGHADRDAYDAGAPYVDVTFGPAERPTGLYRTKVLEFTEPGPALPTIGSTIYARWAVGPAQRGSGWLDPRTADELDAWTVAEVWPALGTVLVQVPNGGTITIRPGQYLERPHPVPGL